METKKKKIYVKPEIVVIECDSESLLAASPIEVSEEDYTRENTGGYWGD